MQKLKQKNEIKIEQYSDLIKTVARFEYSRLSYSLHLFEFDELINIGATTVYVMLSSHPEKCHNEGYMATAIKWAIKNELRRRYRWYSLKHTSKINGETEENIDKIEKEELREAIYETIISIDELTQADNPLQIEDTKGTPEDRLELLELKKSVVKALNKLPRREKQVLELRFYKNKKIKDIATELGVSSSRVSKIIQTGLDRIKVSLTSEGIFY